MAVTEIHIKEEDCLLDEQVDKLLGTMLDRDVYHTLISGEDVDVYKPNGDVLLKFRHNSIPSHFISPAFHALEKAAAPSDGRGMAAGIIENETQVHFDTAHIGKTSFRAVTKDGYHSKQVRGKKVRQGIVGYFDRSGRFPYCRMTAFNMNEPDKFQEALPFIQHISKVFEQEMPDRYANQIEYINRTSDDFKIHGTAFTTVTVNMNFRTAAHRDVGDLKEGFGVLSVIRAGHYEGGYLCFPKYGVAVDLRTADIILCDVHELHGNTPVVGKAGEYKRLATVLYYREGMDQCGTADEELERVKSLDRKGITK